MIRAALLCLLVTRLFAGVTDDLFRGRDSGPVRAMNSVLLQVAPLDSNVLAFDVILENQGISTARKAQNFIRDYPLDPMSTWMLLVLADYYSIEGKPNTARDLLEKAKTRDDVIINDVYYMMIDGRLNGKLESSPGLTDVHRNNTLAIDVDNARKKADDTGLLANTGPDLPGLPIRQNASPAARPAGKYHLQVGAYSEPSNSDRIVSLFRDKNYPIQIREKKSGDRLIYLVWIGNFQDRDSALIESEKIEQAMSIKSFVVVDP